MKELVTNTDWVPLIASWGGKIVLALVIYIIGKWIARRITAFVKKLMTARDADPTLINFLSNVVYAILLVAVILASLDTLGLPVTSLLAVVGAAGLAVGLALKDSLGNFASGVMLVMFRPFVKGDVVEVAGVTGKVNEVRIFSTIMTTPDNKQIIIPNGQVAADTITNYTANDQRRVDLVFGVGYDDDLKVAREVLTRICADHPKVLDDPATSIFVLNLGDSSVDFAVRPWARTEDYWTVWGDILEQGKLELEAAGCNIPYPQTDVHLHAANPLADVLKS
ncbi:MAG: mechanosensitive ion channel [Xanthomonadales bacterium]|nr:mechanosensitive ion channel [Gammaproteobacteria bacterium]NND58166.1 mechanosensitive ion channel [Xanthomonadales bacterium]NNK52513.1 mechanosensitive ion channel [Xanthomonadales bacterium]